MAADTVIPLPTGAKATVTSLSVSKSSIRLMGSSAKFITKRAGIL